MNKRQFFLCICFDHVTRGKKIERFNEFAALFQAIFFSIDYALSNPKYNEMNRYNHLGGTQMHDIDTEKLLLIQNTLGVTAFAKMGI